MSALLEGKAIRRRPLDIQRANRSAYLAVSSFPQPVPEAATTQSIDIPCNAEAARNKSCLL